MKIALICLLALTFTIANALDKKQLPPAECLTIPDDVQNCITALAGSDKSTFCNNCKDALIDYYNTCTGGAGVDAVNAGFEQLCGDDGGNGGNGGNGGDNGGNGGNGGDNGGDGDSSAATVGATLFTIVSAALVAVGN